MLLLWTFKKSPPYSPLQWLVSPRPPEPLLVRYYDLLHRSTGTDRVPRRTGPRTFFRAFDLTPNTVTWSLKLHIVLVDPPRSFTGLSNNCGPNDPGWGYQRISQSSVVPANGYKDSPRGCYGYNGQTPSVKLLTTEYLSGRLYCWFHITLVVTSFPSHRSLYSVRIPFSFPNSLSVRLSLSSMYSSDVFFFSPPLKEVSSLIDRSLRLSTISVKVLSRSR